MIANSPASKQMHLPKHTIKNGRLGGWNPKCSHLLVVGSGSCTLYIPLDEIDTPPPTSKPNPTAHKHFSCSATAYAHIGICECFVWIRR